MSGPNLKSFPKASVLAANVHQAELLQAADARGDVQNACGGVKQREAPQAE